MSNEFGYPLHKFHSNMPEEKMLAEALTSAGIKFIHESQAPDATKALDFRIIGNENADDLYIEVKQFYSPRSVEQCGRVENVIMVQGRKAAEFLARLIRESKVDVSSNKVQGAASGRDGVGN